MTTGGSSGWDAIAEAYDRLAGTDKDVVYADLRSALWSALGDVRRKWVLDVGCGSGWLAAQLADDHRNSRIALDRVAASLRSVRNHDRQWPKQRRARLPTLRGRHP